MAKDELQRKLDGLDQQNDRIISAIFDAAQKENITLGHLDDILDSAKDIVLNRMRNTPVSRKTE